MSFTRPTRVVKCALAASCIWACASLAVAEMGDVAFTVEAELSGVGNVSLDIMQEWGTWNGGTWTFSLTDVFPDGFTFNVPGYGDIGELPQMDVVVHDDPEVNLNFAVVAGSSATIFHIASSVMTFPTLGTAEGQASAAFSLQDINGDGASLSGIGDTGGGYLAQYNGWAGNPFGPDGTTFAETHFSMLADPFLNSDLTENVPLVGYGSIPDPVSSISSLVSFEMSAFDFASGTTRFTVVPEPASLALLVLGGIVAIRRR